MPKPVTGVAAEREQRMTAATLDESATFLARLADRGATGKAMQRMRRDLVDNCQRADVDPEPAQRSRSPRARMDHIDHLRIDRTDSRGRSAGPRSPLR